MGADRRGTVPWPLYGLREYYAQNKKIAPKFTVSCWLDFLLEFDTKASCFTCFDT